MTQVKLAKKTALTAAEARLTSVESTRGQVLTGTAAPVLGDLSGGDTYYQLDGSGNVIAEYVKTSS